jgi:hypothetical protein
MLIYQEKRRAGERIRMAQNTFWRPNRATGPNMATQERREKFSLFLIAVFLE